MPENAPYGKSEPFDAFVRRIAPEHAHLILAEVARARADQREATIRHAAEWLRTLGRDDMATALVRALSVTGDV